MRRFAVCRVFVLLFVLSLVLPAQAAPKRDASQPGFFDRAISQIVNIIKRIVPFEEFQPNIPKP